MAPYCCASASTKFACRDDGLYRAWTNVEFIADDGSVNEIDALVVSPRGFFLIEIKSFPGVLFGDGQSWRWRRPNGSEKPLPHPLILANTKAKRLRSLLARQPALRNERDPYITALVFLSSPDLDCRLHDIGRTSVCGRDPDPVPLGTPQPETEADRVCSPSWDRRRDQGSVNAGSSDDRQWPQPPAGHRQLLHRLRAESHGHRQCGRASWSDDDRKRGLSVTIRARLNGLAGDAG